jgi:protein-S-isoprenylcysteine O-methyltransferase Ste14
MRAYKISWVLWIIGTILVVGSWVGLVPAGLAWFGFGMSLVGCVMGLVCRKPVRCERQVVAVYSTADEIAKLDLLRREGVLSEEEFRREKAELLARR